MTRGDVHEVKLAPGRGHEQRGRRYGVIVQSDLFDDLSTVLLAPTSSQVREASWRPVITVAGRQTRVLVEQTRAVDRARLGRRVTRLSVEETWALDDALRLVLSL